MGLYEAAAAFGLGGTIYIILELAYRGRTHFSMFLAGGAAFLLMHGAFARLDAGLLFSCVAGGVIVTAVEFVFGFVVNIKLRLAVWDYSAKRGNLFGQICPRYFIMWVLLSLPAQLFSKLLALAFD